MTMDEAFMEAARAVALADKKGGYYGEITLKIEASKVSLVVLHQTLK
jgi:hypothetical protein